MSEDKKQSGPRIVCEVNANNYKRLNEHVQIGGFSRHRVVVSQHHNIPPVLEECRTNAMLGESWSVVKNKDLMIEVLIAAMSEKDRG